MDWRQWTPAAVVNKRVAERGSRRVATRAAADAPRTSLQQPADYVTECPAKMKWLSIVWTALLLQGVCPQEADVGDREEAIDETARGRRDVIEEEKYYNIRAEQPWLPGHADPSSTSTTREPHTTDNPTDKPTGRGARASNENWIKLPFPDRDVTDLQPPKAEIINSRMPRVNFVTNKLEAAESRDESRDELHDKSQPRSDDLRTELVPERRYRQYPRQAAYYPERYYEPYPADPYRRDPYEAYDRRASGRLDRYDAYDVPRKPKRIIYYAHLPDVVRDPYRVDPYRTDPYRIEPYRVDPYRVDPYRDDDYNARAGRYDYRFRNRYPYAPLRKEERRFGFRDLAPAGTVAKDKKVEDKVTPTPVLPKKEEKSREENRDVGRNTINSHQYHDAGDFFLTQAKGYSGVRADDSYLRFDGPLFHGTVEDPYQRKY